nr:MAG TPA: transmembrane protein [Caudoviricetes sp.]
MSTKLNVYKTYNGIGFLSLLGLVFIILKLVGVINWSWWLVLLPLYIPVISVLVLLIFLGIIIFCSIKSID